MCKKRIFVLGFVLISAGAGIAIVDRPGVENVSPSMDLGLYLRVPQGEISAGDIVEFPVPAQAREFAERHCIEGPILKRVAWAVGDRLFVQGDHMHERSFDSDVYGMIPAGLVTGKFVPLWTWPPEDDTREFKGGCE